MKPSIISVAGRVVRFTAVCAAVCALGSCSFDKPLVGLLVYNETDPYMETFAGQILAAAEGFFPVKLYYAGNSQLIQNEQIEKILSDKPDVLMINPVDRLGAYAIIRRLQAANVPVIFFNREPLAGDLALWDKTYYVGARAEQSGQMQARLVMDLFGNNPGKLNQYDRNGDGKIQTIILKGEQGHQDAETRTSEVLYTFEKNGFAVETLALEVANWNRDEAYTKMGRLISLYQNRMELVLCNNDDMALGAISRMRQAGLFKDTNKNGAIDRHDREWIPVIGIDGLSEAEDAISEGYLYGTVKNDSLRMAGSMVELANALLARVPPSSLSVPLEDDKYVWIDYRPYISSE